MREDANKNGETEKSNNRSGSLVNGVTNVFQNISNGVAAKKSFFKGFLGARSGAIGATTSANTEI